MEPGAVAAAVDLGHSQHDFFIEGLADQAPSQRTDHHWHGPDGSGQVPVKFYGSEDSGFHLLSYSKDFFYGRTIAFPYREMGATDFHLIALQAFNLMDGDNVGFMNAHKVC